MKLPRDLYVLCNKILKLAPWNIIAILLAGSLSRGEGTTIKKGNQVHVLSDYDLEVIVRVYDPLFIRRANRLEKNSSLNVRIGIIPAFSLKSLKLIQMYELKKKGLLLIGNRDVLNQIPMDSPKDIPLLEGVRRLLNGIIDMIEAIRYENIKGKLSHNQVHKLIYSSSKAYLACCSALLTLIGEYRPTYRDRCILFARLFKAHFKDLNKTFADFPEQVQRALDFKLRPDLSVFNKPLDEWFKAKNYILATLEYFLTKYFSENNDLFISLEKLQNLPIQPIFNFYYALNSILFLKKIPPLKSFFTVPMIAIQISAVFLICSISEKNGSIDLDMLKKAKEYISTIYRTKGLSLDWDLLRNIIIKTWKIAPEYTST